MTVQEAINVLEKPSDHIKTIQINHVTGIVYSADLVKAFEIAIKALEKQSKLECVIERLEEMKLIRVEQCHDDYEIEVMTESNFDDAIEIIKDELMK